MRDALGASPWRLELAVLANYLPGVLVQLGQPKRIERGPGWVEGLHARRCTQTDQALTRLGFQAITPVFSIPRRVTR